MITNQKGALTVDFLFALVIVLITTLVFAVFSFTLATVEGIQYTAFAASRAYYAGHTSEDMQRQYGEAKFNELRTKKLKFFLNPEWFDLRLTLKNFSNDYAGNDPRDILTGARIDVNAKILSISTPFLGTTDSGSGFRTRVTSFLGREPTSQECQAFWQSRWEQIKSLHEAYGRVAGKGDTEMVDDNGC